MIEVTTLLPQEQLLIPGRPPGPPAVPVGWAVYIAPALCCTYPSSFYSFVNTLMLFLLSVCLYLCAVPCSAEGWGRAPLLMEHLREWGVSGVFSYPSSPALRGER